MESCCKNCQTTFTYRPSQSRGIFCSNTCQGEYVNTNNVLSGKAGFRGARKYVLKHWEYKCSDCTLNEWQGKSLTLQLDHVDGNLQNNKLSNLRWLCPNCHSLTPTFGSKNLSEEGRKRMSTKKRNTMV